MHVFQLVCFGCGSAGCMGCRKEKQHPAVKLSQIELLEKRQPDITLRRPFGRSHQASSFTVSLNCHWTPPELPSRRSSSTEPVLFMAWFISGTQFLCLCLGFSLARENRWIRKKVTFWLFHSGYVHHKSAAIRCNNWFWSESALHIDTLIQLQTHTCTSGKVFCPQAFSLWAMLRVMYGSLCRHQWRTSQLLGVPQELQRSWGFSVPDVSFLVVFSCARSLKVFLQHSHAWWRLNFERKQCIILSHATFISLGWVGRGNVCVLHFLCCPQARTDTNAHHK